MMHSIYTPPTVNLRPVNKPSKTRRIYHAVAAGFFAAWLLLRKISLSSFTADPSASARLNSTFDIKGHSDHPLTAPTPNPKQENIKTHDDESMVNPDNPIVILPRIWRSWPSDSPLPCFEPDKDMFTNAVQITHSRIGFLYVRPLKTGSSSMNGSVIRAAQQVAKRGNYSFTTCKVRVFHGFASTYGYIQRDKEKSFLYSSLRDPSSRAVSRFFFARVSRQKVQATDHNFVSYLKATFQSSYLTTLSLMPYQDTPEHYQRDIDHTLQNYDFIAITELMDESFVVMQMLLGLSTTDMLYFSVKTNGGYDDGGTKMGCTYIQKSTLTDGMKEYLQSEDWKARTKSDYMLYDAAKESLDLTIDHLGRDEFKKNLKDFRLAMAVVKSKCNSHVKFPCAPNGTRNTHTDCLWEDSGCGQSCLNKVTQELQSIET